MLNLTHLYSIIEYSCVSVIRGRITILIRKGPVMIGMLLFAQVFATLLLDGGPGPCGAMLRAVLSVLNIF